MPWPITIEDAYAARARIAPHLAPTPLRHYRALDDEVGHGIRVLVKHENFNPTNAFKARNAIALVTALSADQRARGVIAATRGNHGAGLAWAGARLGVPVVIVVPHGNNPEKNTAIRSHGAELVEAGKDYDEAAAHAAQLARTRGLAVAHSTNDPAVIAGACTLSLELFEQAPGVLGELAGTPRALDLAAGDPARDERDGIADLPHDAPSPAIDAVVVAVGGGSQAVGAIVAARALSPATKIYGVQAANASAAHDSWHARERRTTATANTIADGLATRATYDLTWEPLRDGLAGFVAVTEVELGAAIRTYLRTTHNLAEAAGAAGLAGLFALRQELAGKAVAVILSGANLDTATLRDVLAPGA